ncbi:hypothetical protein GQ42DRAFT_72137 [Ramicandelaber brevisporus]|nr:hypothetical protein GQ42DRAFT_72137 [Ramicandelaber brevisporus]
MSKLLPSSTSEVIYTSEQQRVIDEGIAAIDRLSSSIYKSEYEIKREVFTIEHFLNKSRIKSVYRLAIESGIIEAFARALILLHAMGKLDYSSPIYSILQIYKESPTETYRGDRANINYIDIVAKQAGRANPMMFRGGKCVSQETDQEAVMLTKIRLYAIFAYVKRLCPDGPKQIGQDVAATRAALTLYIDIVWNMRVYGKGFDVQLNTDYDHPTLEVMHKGNCYTFLV